MTPTIGINVFLVQTHPYREGRCVFAKPKVSIGRSLSVDAEYDEEHDVSRSPDWAWLAEQVAAHWEERKPGYRDGVVLVPVPVVYSAVPVVYTREVKAAYSAVPAFYTREVVLTPGDKLVGSYKARVEGEEPRKSYNLSALDENGEPRRYQPAKAVDVVCYRRDVLEEGDEPRTGMDWDIITVLAKASTDESPMTPETLMANHFGASGGTATNMTPEQFERALRESYNYWKNRALIASE